MSATPATHGAARGVSAPDDALLAQRRAFRRRPAAFQDHKAATEDLARVSPDAAGFLPRGMEAQADRRRAGQDDARLREARHRRAEGRPRFGAGAHQAGKCLAFPAGAAPGNCFAIVGRGSSRRRPLTPTRISESSSGRDALRGCLDAAGRRGEGKNLPSPLAPELAAYVAKRTT